MVVTEMSASNENGYHSGYATSIDITRMFRNMSNAKLFAVDIGGSLAKVAYMSEVQHARKRLKSFCSEDSDKERTIGNPIYEIKDQQECGLRLHFIKFETKYVETCVDFIQQNLLEKTDNVVKVMKATGGGAHKYKDMLTTKLGVRVDKEDEMQCLIRGCNFVLSTLPDEVFQFCRDEDSQYVFRHLESNEIFPYLLVNIGSGVSIIQVNSKDHYQRVGGTSMGGGTFWGLGSLLTKAKGFDELLELATQGQHKNVDVLVKDIYGGPYTGSGLPADLTASSFGKAVRSCNDKQEDGHKFAECDIAKSLLQMISNDIAQIASLYARLSGIKKIFFSGYFIRGIPATMHTLTYGINYWSKDAQQALFLRHEGYLGAIGAFLKGAEEYGVSPLQFKTWEENYAASTGLPTATSKEKTLDGKPMNQQYGGLQCDVLELDQISQDLVPFPLLSSPGEYQPDTDDLTVDSEARKYWLDCFGGSALDKVVERAIASQPNLPDAKDRAEKFRAKYQDHLNVLYDKPFSYGSLTVRSLLDTREQCLDEFQFPDLYAEVKQQENEDALRLFSQRVQDLDNLPHDDQRQESLVRGILAGNVFDWGAMEVAELMEKKLLGFSSAMDKLQKRPWLIDDLDEWINNTQNKVYKCALVFVDNSGADIILGVFPFVRYLLLCGTKVILAANSYPALNDVMFSELNILLEQLTGLCPDIR
ncbi:4'-phosphopantetheine phosphatase-like [Actinia tenebrosa]|uniref:4'-phosphopantetheine phosphatase n=1 Tax=Actinia tenebrosa TaxID=6105 RepID=A0A6P8GYH7_ACTTE|nr:4'-phosphopantetheine phosphatase-like [Actinia tenebrosa]